MEKSSFFKSIHNPYYICAPNYTDKSAGIKALHYLCHALNELGAEAYLVGCSEESHVLRTPLLSSDDVQRHLNLGMQPIAIYPEVVTGNPFNAPHVVRWLLNKAGYLGGEETFEPEELIYAFSPEYVGEGMDASIMSVPFVNSTIFNNVDNPNDANRKGVCFYAHKYLAAGGKLTAETEGAISLCQDQQLSQQEIADILRRSEYLLCFEPSSMIVEARFCGCPVVMVPSPYLMENLAAPLKDSGIALSFELSEMKKAKESVNERFAEYQVHIGHCWNHVKDFYIRSQEEFLDRQLRSRMIKDKWVDPVLRLILKLNSGAKPFLSKQIESARQLRWLDNNTLSEGRAITMAERMLHDWQHQPTFHLIMVLNPDELVLLPDTLESLQQQLYSAWGLSIIAPIAQPDVLIDLPENIEWIQLSGTLNETINKVVNETGLDWVFLLMPGDKILSQGLWAFSDCINQQSEYRLIYSDEIKGSESPQLMFKPDFNLELLRGSSYLGRSVIIRRDTFETIGGYTGLAYVYATDLAFHIYEQWGVGAIGHIDDVLYSATDTKHDSQTLSDNELAVRVAHFDRLSTQARVMLLSDNTFKINYTIENQPFVSVIVANKNNASSIDACLKSLYRVTNYDNYEVLIVDQMSDIEDMAYIYQEAQDSFGERLRLLSFGSANYSSAINFGVSQAAGDYIVVLSSLAMPANDTWLTEIVSIAQQNDVGVVGGKVVEEEEPYKVIHAGGVLGIANDVKGLLSGHDFDDDAYMNRAALTQAFSFVSSAGFIVKKAQFLSVNGLDEADFANSNYCITDFCLKIKALGLNNIWTPHAVFRLNSSQALKNNGISDFQTDSVEDIVLHRWRKYAQQDPSYNRNLSLRDADYSVDLKVTPTWLKTNSNKLKIMAFPFNSTAIGEFRTRGPLDLLSSQGLIETCYLPNHEALVVPFVPSHADVLRAQPDILFLNYGLSDQHYDFLQWLKAETTCCVIFSIDDLIISLPKGNDSKRFLYKDIRHRLRKTLALCDRLIVSTQPLADAFSGFCDDIVVVPNSLDWQRWSNLPTPQTQQRDKLRVGWAGGQLHNGDLEIIIEVVKKMAHQVDWIFMGMCPDDLRPYIHEYHEFTSFSDYPEKMAALDLDLAIAPLEYHPFNEAKSNLRLLEYGMLGWPVICTDIYPYQTNNPPVVRVDNTQDAWLHALQTAISEKNLLKSKGIALQQWVKSNYLLNQHTESWLGALIKR